MGWMLVIVMHVGQVWDQGQVVRAGDARFKTEAKCLSALQKEEFNNPSQDFMFCVKVPKAKKEPK